MSDFKQMIISQFQKPRGWFGYLAGAIMYHRQSNRQRNRWMVKLLELKEGLHVLELGCGPGFALEAMLDLVPNLHVVGLDHSELMVKMASQRLGEHHQVKIQVGNATKLNQVPGHFDRICCANVHQFWKDDKPILQSLYEKLKPNGRLVITYQPRCNNPSNKAADDEGIRLKNKLSEVGFSEIKVLELDLKPVKAISIIARKDSH